ELSVSLVNSLLIAASLVFFTFLVLFRNPRHIAVAMIPNFFPLIVFFGAAGFCGVRLDIGGIMTASIALGVAVDDTLHFMVLNDSARKQFASPLFSLEHS